MTQSNKEAFFRDVLVPTGQVLEVLLELVRGTMQTDDYSNLVHDTFEPLNLASCYAINPATKDLTALEVAVKAYCDAALRAVELMGSSRDPFVATTFGVRNTSRAKMPRENLVKVKTAFTAGHAALADRIHAAIGYSQTRRTQWLAESLSQPTPLTANGQSNKWRTFVRNLSWERAIDLFKLKAWVPLDKFTKNAFTNDVGSEKASYLWQEVFSVSADGEDRARLPFGVSVKSTSTGELQVEASFDPRQFFDNAQLQSLKSPGFGVGAKGGDKSLPPALAEAIARRYFNKTSDVLTFSADVEAAQAWLTGQAATKEEVLQLYEDCLQEARINAVKDKLETHFSSQEKLLLAKILAPA